MKKQKLSFKKVMLVVVILLLFIGAIYNVYDNNRFIVAEQITGDMNKYENSDSTSSQAILELLNGIENKETVFWIDGNTGPFAIETVNGNCTGKLTDMGKTIEQAGVKYCFPLLRLQKAMTVYGLSRNYASRIFK